MATSLDGLHPTLMRPRVEAVLADPEAKGMGLFVVSAFRSIAKQEQLFAAAVRKYGSEKAARMWVAPPGRSNHGPSRDNAGNKVSDQRRYGKWGAAVDLGVPGLAAVSGQWPEAIERKVNAICARHGLYSPMQWEDWHFEPDPDWTPPTQPPPPSAIDLEESLLMPLGKSVEDDRRAWVRLMCLEFWGREPSAADLDFLQKEVGLKGTDNVLAQIADHSYCAAFRSKRGW